MYAGSVTGKRDAAIIYKAALYGWRKGSDTEYLMEKLFIIESGFSLGNGRFRHNLGNFKMSVLEFFPCGSRPTSKNGAPGRIKLYFSLMQEIPIFLMGLPVFLIYVSFFDCGEK